MKIAIVGAGGIGSKFGALLSSVAEVWLIHHRDSHVQTLRENGLTLIRNEQEVKCEVHAATDASEVGAAELIIVTVKAYNTREAVRRLKPIVASNTLVTSFQNGLGNFEILEEELGREHVLSAITFHGATLQSPGRVLDRGNGQTYFATRPDIKHSVETLAETFNAAGVETLVHDNVDGLLWGKLCMVAGINAPATLLQVSNGALNDVPEARELCLQVIKEVMAVAEAKHIALPFDPCERFDAVTRATHNMYSGTLLDALRGKGTEIQAITGSILREANLVDVDVPTNRTLFLAISAMLATRSQRIDATTVKAVQG